MTAAQIATSVNGSSDPSFEYCAGEKDSGFTLSWIKGFASYCAAGADLGLRAYVRKSLPQWYYERQQLLHAQDAFRAAGVAFIHVPRTAGLSVVRAVYHQDLWCHFTVSALEKNSRPDVRRLPRFAVVRNPWDRAVSAYHFAKQGGVPGGAEMFRPERYRGADFDTFESFVHQYLAVRSHGSWMEYSVRSRIIWAGAGVTGLITSASSNTCRTPENGCRRR